MAKLYRIKNWADNYENNRTREMKNMSWVPLPINLHGSGYVALMSKKNGPAMFGTWCALLELAATCEIRGTFSRGRGIPHTISTISSQLRIPEKLIAATLELLESEEIDWVESIESDIYKENPAPLPQANCGETAVKLRDDCGETAVSGRKEGIEGISIDQQKLQMVPIRAKRDNSPNKDQQGWFEEFWNLYWRKTAKDAAIKAFHKKIKTLEDWNACKSRLMAESASMLKRDNEMRPHAATWLNREDFHDSATTSPTLPLGLEAYEPRCPKCRYTMDICSCRYNPYANG